MMISVLEWNLSVVLSALLTDPYEPLGQTILLHKSRKVAFLLAMATVARVSELHALDPLYKH